MRKCIGNFLALPLGIVLVAMIASCASTPIAPAVAQAPAPAAKQEIYTITLYYSDVRAMALLVQDFYGVQASGIPESEMILLKGTHQAVQNAMEFLRDMDVDVSKKEPNTFFIYPLKNAKAAEEAAILKDMLHQGFFEQDDPTGDIYAPFVIATDVRTNSLVVFMTDKREENVVRYVIELLDRSLEQPKEPVIEPRYEGGKLVPP